MQTSYVFREIFKLFGAGIQHVCRKGESMFRGRHVAYAAVHRGNTSVPRFINLTQIEGKKLV